MITRKLLRTAAIIATVGALSISATACSGTAAPTATEKTRGETIDVTVPMPVLPKSMLAEFTKSTGIKVKWNTVDFDSLMTKIAASGAAHTYYGDVTYFNFNNIQQYSKLGWFLPLGKYLPASATKDTVGKAAFTYNKQMLGMPYDASVGITTLNKTMFAKAGITTMPTTIDEYTADLKAIKTAGIVKYPLNIPFSASEGLTAYWIQATVAFGGPSIFDKSGKEQFSSPDSPGYKAAEWMVGAMKDGLVAPGAINDGDYQGQQTLQAQGLAASTLYDYSGNISAIYNDPKQSKVANQIVYIPMPGVTGVSSNIDVADAIGIPSTAKAPAAAAKFVQWLTDPKTQIKLAGDGAADEAWGPQGVPSNLTAINTLNAAGKIPGGDVIVDILKNHSQPYFIYGAPEWYPQFSHAVQTSLHAAAAGTMSVADAIKAMAAAADQNSN